MRYENNWDTTNVRYINWTIFGNVLTCHLRNRREEKPKILTVKCYYEFMHSLTHENDRRRLHGDTMIYSVHERQLILGANCRSMLERNFFVFKCFCVCVVGEWFIKFSLLCDTPVVQCKPAERRKWSIILLMGAFCTHFSPISLNPVESLTWAHTIWPELFRCVCVGKQFSSLSEQLVGEIWNYFIILPNLSPSITHKTVISRHHECHWMREKCTNPNRDIAPTTTIE